MRLRSRLNKLLVTLLFGAIFLITVRLVSYEIRANRNVENSLKLRIGMNRSTVLQIMGDRFKSSRISKNEEEIFYTPPYLSSDGIYLTIKNDTLSNIIYYE